MAGLRDPGRDWEDRFALSLKYRKAAMASICPGRCRSRQILGGLGEVDVSFSPLARYVRRTVLT